MTKAAAWALGVELVLRSVHMQSWRLRSLGLQVCLRSVHPVVGACASEPGPLLFMLRKKGIVTGDAPSWPLLVALLQSEPRFFRVVAPAGNGVAVQLLVPELLAAAAAAPGTAVASGKLERGPSVGSSDSDDEPSADAEQLALLMQLLEAGEWRLTRVAWHQASSYRLQRGRTWLGHAQTCRCIHARSALPCGCPLRRQVAA